MVAAAGAAAAVLVASLRFGAAVDAAPPGIPGPGALTEWALPALTLLATVLDVLTVGLTVTAAFLLPGVRRLRRLRRAGHAWSASRTVSWVGGMLLLGAMTGLGVARYAYVLVSVHLVQHLVLATVVPILLIGGAPVPLALRALRRPADPQVRGPREWLLLVLHGRSLRFLSHPLVALAVYVSSLYGLYLTGLLGTLMRHHLGHLAMLASFVVAGLLLFRVLLGVDPARRRVHPALLIVVHLVAVAAHAP
jgi:cytochrome c oxidase assembly factor CtaG